MENVKFLITEDEAYNFYRLNKKKGFSRVEIAEQILTQTGFPIKDTADLDEDELIMFEGAQDIIRRRLIRLVEAVQKRNFKNFKGDETFFDIRKFQGLVKEDSQTLSQESNSSTHSWLEEQVPSQDYDSRKRKPFEEIGARTKRRRTDDIFHLVVKEAEKQQITVTVLLAYLGYRASYQENKTISANFKTVTNDCSNNTVPLDLCLYIREKCEIGKATWTDLRLALKPFVNLVPYGEMAQICKEILPCLQPFHYGWKANLSEVVLKTLERLPTQTANSIISLDQNNNGIIAHFVCGADTSGKDETIIIRFQFNYSMILCYVLFITQSQAKIPFPILNMSSILYFLFSS